MDKTHGLSNSLCFKRWLVMRRRCYDKNFNMYVKYGAIGIRVCKEWKNNFLKFYQDMGDPSEDRPFLDRIDGKKGYSKLNCRWASRKEQNSNRHNVQNIEHKGKRMHFKDWCKELGIHPATAGDKVYRSGRTYRQALGFDPTPEKVWLRNKKGQYRGAIDVK